MPVTFDPLGSFVFKKNQHVSAKDITAQGVEQCKKSQHTASKWMVVCKTPSPHMNSFGAHLRWTEAKEENLFVFLT